MNRLLGLSEHKMKSRWVCQEGIKYLKVHTMKHFAEEEAYMRAINYGGYEMHRHLHNNFRLQTLPALEKELEETDYSADAVRHFLGVCIGWMISHTLTEDHAITGKTASKWERLPDQKDLEVLVQTIKSLIDELFMLDVRLVNEHYTGEDFGTCIYYRLVCRSPKGDRQESIFIIENQMLMGTVGTMLGSHSDKVDDVVVNAARYISRQFIKRVEENLAPAEQYEVIEENFLTGRQFQEIFEKVHSQFSLLFGTEAGYFAFCLFASSLENNEMGRAINARNAMSEIKKCLDTSQKKKILIVDDSNTVRQGMKRLLEKEYKVAIADSGMSGVKAIMLERPDLILLDYKMPGCDGIQTLKMIRTEKKYANIPVIFLTGKADQDSIARIMAARPAGYLLKTMRPVDVKKNVDAFFSRK